MDSKEKAQLTRINKIPTFKKNMEKLTIGEELTNEEKSYLLSVALLFIKSFEADKRHTPYLEFAYYIFLKYATTYQDYRPLYDFAINFGFYPIAKDIQEKGLIPEMKLTDEIASIKLEEYNYENYIETLEQQRMRLNLLKDNAQNISYVAPTSYGKSSLIIEHIKNNLDQNLKVGIIVPTKSLLVQTYKLVRNAGLDRRIIIHDEMYREETSFIGVLTQERALRLLEKHDVKFDILYIDEAHNLFEKDGRSILLSRLIRYNAQKNKDQKVIYLSPLINNSNNLRLDFQHEIVEQKIAYNMKEPEIFEYREDNQIFLYNRFINEFYSYGEIITKRNEPGYITYIKGNKANKNFIYHRAPKKIEGFSKELFLNLPFIELKRETKKLIRELEELVHKDFQMIELLKKGIVYLHGRLPEAIKEYLEYQFKKNTDLNIVIANKVILEGINLPVDNLFIMHSNGLKEKEVTNLIGRVNRLNEVFKVETNQLAKLLPSVHFLNSQYNKKNIKMENLIRKLRSNIFSDEIKNPILAEYDMTKVTDEAAQEKIQFIRENEDLILTDPPDELEKLKRIFIKSGLENMLSIKDSYLKEIKRRIEIFKGNPTWLKMDIIDKVYGIYIYGFDKYDIADFEIGRLRSEKARNYYRRHLLARKINSLKENITETYNYFKSRVVTGEANLYIGVSYGEKSLYTENYQGGNKDVYVDLSTKSDAELINLAIIKLKIEDDFISYKLNTLIITLFELELISEEEYNNVVYGTNDQKKIDLIKTGLSFSLITKLQKDNQLENISFDANNNLVENVNFLEYKNNLNGFYRFEVDKYL
ncbi:TPA: DEAD/DEAH box helicase [Bacillus cereus]|nr:DEAD/DEAH box helicase [Bacillus cereus]HDR6272263.1 DEAD/DEAH box helicase [Bacillus cereus]